MKHLFIVPLLLMLVGCEAPALKKTNAANSQVEVELLTEFDGIRVYRLYDGGRPVYIAAQGGNMSAAWSRSCGKGCVDHEVVSTVVRR